MIYLLRHLVGYLLQLIQRIQIHSKHFQINTTLRSPSSAPPVEDSLKVNETEISIDELNKAFTETLPKLFA
jgi:hypothetical protein